LFTSSGQVVGSMPTGTSLNVLSPRSGVFMLLKKSLNVCVTLGATHATFQRTMLIFEKRWRTVPTMACAVAPPPSCTTVKKPPISVFARFCMNSSEFWRNSS
jgi:hypothetical protein